MVARTFKQKAAGGTVLVDASFRGLRIHEGSNILLDIGAALTAVRDTCAQHGYSDLDKTMLLNG